mgnify:FL=1
MNSEMNSAARRRLRWFAPALAAVLCACAVGPQVPTLRLEKVAREVPGAEPRWQQADAQAAGVRVWRAEREIRAGVGMQLQPGDVVETGPHVAAVIRYSASGTTVLDQNTRVRLGSIEVFFGRVFANVRGFFEASSDSVVAGVAGTRFLFEVRPDRSTRVAVADGVVTCNPREGTWGTVRLFPGQALQVSFPVRAQPRPVAADPSELREAADWAESVAAAPAEGWCCSGGRTVPGWSNRCAGNAFSTDRRVVEALCRPAPPPEPSGWCCADGRLTETRRSQCRGSFSDNLALARRTCAARYVPAPPIR